MTREQRQLETINYDKVIGELNDWIHRQPNMKDDKGLPTINPVLTARALLIMFIEREKERL